MNKYIFSTISLLFIYCSSHGQAKKQRDHDTTYYVSYREKLTARIYLSRKYTTLKLNPPSNSVAPEMKYVPNTTLNLGIGGTYRSLTINIGVGITKFNPDDLRGKTTYLDLQSH